MSSSSSSETDETTQRVVPILSCVLTQLCARNNHIALKPARVSKFHALHPPAIAIEDYLKRIAKYACCSGTCFTMALIYIDRIIKHNEHFVVNSLNVHRLLITAVMLAAKFYDDAYYNNTYYGKVGGVPGKEMNALEIEFLFLLNFDLFVSGPCYERYHQELMNHVWNSTQTDSCQCRQFAALPCFQRHLQEQQEEQPRPPHNFPQQQQPPNQRH